MYYVYVVKNRRNNRGTYLGYTNNLRRRISEHKIKNSDLIYFEGYKSELDARTREKKLKQRGQAVRWLKERIKDSLKNLEHKK